VNVALSKYYEDFVREQIESGRYGNASEVVRAGLRALQRDEQDTLWHIPDLEAKLMEGLSRPAAPFKPSDLERVRARTGKRLLQLEKS
jgi:putative addiction module CopG family antidote